MPAPAAAHGLSKYRRTISWYAGGTCPASRASWARRTSAGQASVRHGGAFRVPAAGRGSAGPSGTARKVPGRRMKSVVRPARTARHGGLYGRRRNVRWPFLT